jgi:spore maturation protein CgeB
MKVLVIGAGASWSTRDVEIGVVEGLRANGVEVGHYMLDSRIMASGEYLKRCWRRAKKVQATVEEPTAADILLHAVQDSLTRALLHQADWVLLVSAMFVPRPFLEILQRAGLPVAVVLTESPYDQEKELRWAAHADLVWTNERSSVEAFRGVQPLSFYLPHAMRPDVHRPDMPIAEDVPAHDVVFVGSAFSERVELLSAIDWTGIDVALYGNWARLPARSKLRHFVREGVIDNEKTAALYRRARIGLNLYRESMGWANDAPRIAHAESLNPRAYELAACGCFHLSHARAEVSEVCGDLVPTFKTAFECETLIRRWLADDAGRADVSRQLPATVAAHTWTARGKQMVGDLRAALPSALERAARSIASKQEAVRVAA